MKKRIAAICLTLIICIGALASCGNDSPYPDRAYTHEAVIEIEGYGKITLALDGNTAPITVNNFVKLVCGKLRLFFFLKILHIDIPALCTW